jgi:4-amino-4-deoxy-L-arabinose transferase-like glycosyltransferase
MLDRPLARGVAVAVLLATMALLLVTSSRHKKLAYDEYDNLAYGYRVRTLGPLPPLNGQRMPILVLNALGCPAPCTEADATRRGDSAHLRGEGTRLLVRLPTMVFALALGLVLYSWAAEWLGARAALLALGLYALHPSFLAHGKQVTSDVQAAFFTVAAVYPVWRMFRGRGGLRANLALAALATTGALVSKYTSVLLFPLLALLWLLETKGRPRKAALLGAAAYLTLVLVFLNAAYLFQGTLRRADAYNWKSQRLQLLRSVPLPLPLPRTFVLGLDFSFEVQEQPDVGRGNNYVLGRLNTDGVWYAFPLMVLLKTPLGFFGLLLLAAWARAEPGAA